jgi:Amt family ammonium transporter
MEPSTNGADPTVPLIVYNGTIATGGDSLVENLNVFYNVSLLGWSCAADAGLMRLSRATSLG